MGGYVGNFHDKRRIERQQKEREEERKQLEELRRKAEAQAAKGPLRDYVAGTSEVGAAGLSSVLVALQKCCVYPAFPGTAATAVQLQLSALRARPPPHMCRPLTAWTVFFPLPLPPAPPCHPSFSPAQMLEHAFKAETVGLVTRDEFVQKRETLQERMEVEAKKARLAREEAEAQVRRYPCMVGNPVWIGGVGLVPRAGEAGSWAAYAVRPCESRMWMLVGPGWDAGLQTWCCGQGDV